MKKIIVLIIMISSFTSCRKYLDVVPDNIPTIEYAFSIRSTAERFLFTCYSWMPAHGNFESDPAIMGGGEYWLPPRDATISWGLMLGLQTPTNPLLDYWDGARHGKGLYEGIRDCNIFLDNIHKVPDIEEYERTRWIAEVKVLKAYYHYWLLRMYGPIPIIDKNLPIGATTEEAKVVREPVDKVIDFIVGLLDEASSGLPNIIDNRTQELGRITMPIAKAIKAEILVLAASPLFNGNRDYINLKNSEGESLISAEEDIRKWQRAAVACKEAIDIAHDLGYALYHFTPNPNQGNISDITRTKMSIRNSVAERWNSEVIWANVSSAISQPPYTPRSWDPNRTAGVVTGRFAPPLRIAEMFYTKNGLPIDEDITYEYNNRYQLKTGTSEDKYNIKEGYTTAALHFDRESRFYASLGFDGGIWYGQGRFNDEEDLFYIMGKAGQAANIHNSAFYSVTGYWPKKLVNYQNVIEVSNYATRWYPWPVIRLANLYLLYAEALNESEGPGSESYEYINRVRRRAGLDDVQDSWKNFSNDPGKVTRKDDFREIIHQERMIELVFEGQMFWDLKRWKKARTELSKPITGWDIFQKDASGYYREITFFTPVFRQKDYFWPISEYSILRNDKLVQNPGW